MDPYSPQQNGVMERRNRIIVEMARCTLKSMQVPETLWDEAVCNVVYILNRVTTKALDAVTRYQVWIGRKPNIKHLRVFGCVAHMRVTGGHL